MRSQDVTYTQTDTRTQPFIVKDFGKDEKSKVFLFSFSNYFLNPVKMMTNIDIEAWVPGVTAANASWKKFVA